MLSRLQPHFRAQKAREQFKFIKDRLEVLRIPLKPFEDLVPEFSSVAGASCSFLAYFLDVSGSLETQKPPGITILPVCCLDCYSKPVRFAQPRQQTFLKTFEITKRAIAQAPLAPQACLIVIAQLHESCKSTRNRRPFRRSNVAQTRINTGRNALTSLKQQLTCKSISTVFHRQVGLKSRLGCRGYDRTKSQSFSDLHGIACRACWLREFRTVTTLVHQARKCTLGL